MTKCKLANLPTLCTTSQECINRGKMTARILLVTADEVQFEVGFFFRNFYSDQTYCGIGLFQMLKIFRERFGKRELRQSFGHTFQALTPKVFLTVSASNAPFSVFPPCTGKVYST